MTRYKVIVSLNYRQFSQWCKYNDISPNSREVIYVSTSTKDSTIKLRGLLLKEEDIKKYGQWYIGKYAPDVLQELKWCLHD